MTDILELVIAGSKEGIKNYSAQIVSALLLFVTMLLFPGLRHFVGQSLLEIIKKIFHKPQQQETDEKETLSEEDVFEEADLIEIEDTGKVIEIPKWFKKRRGKEKSINITKEGVIALFLLCLGMLILIFSLWRLNLRNVMNVLGLILGVLFICFLGYFALYLASSADSEGGFFTTLFVCLFILMSIVGEGKKNVSNISYDLLNLLWVLGVLAGCAFVFLSFHIIARNVNAHINAAERGNGEAQYKLGVAYYKKGNYKLSYMWYQLAYLCGYKNAKTAMAEMETAKDGAVAKISLSDVANSKAEAQKKFDGIMRTKAEVIKYYRTKACEGDRIAQYNLGYVYQNGEDVEQNNHLAYVWYSVAQLSGDRKAKSCLEQLKSKFYPSQVAEAEEEARRKFKAIQQRKSKK